MSDHPSIPSQWRIFLTQRLPVMMFAMALTAEALALALDGVPLRRHDLDLLAQNVRLPIEAQQAPNTVIIGDSVTQDVLKNFAIGAEGEVANLTTNKASGLVGAYLLVKRYLKNNKPPRHLFIASTPEFFTFHPSGETARVYVKSVFQEPDEIEYLDGVLNDDEVSFSPAILNLDKRLGLKALALMAPTPDGLIMGSRTPNPEGTHEPRPQSKSLLRALEERGRASLEIPSSNTKILSDICALADRHGITLHIRNAPVAQSTYAAWVKTNILAGFEAQRRTLLQSACSGVNVELYSDQQIVPDGAMRDSDHLVRHDWTNAYAVQLNALMSGWGH